MTLDTDNYRYFEDVVDFMDWLIHNMDSKTDFIDMIEEMAETKVIDSSLSLLENYLMAQENIFKINDGYLLIFL